MRRHSSRSRAWLVVAVPLLALLAVLWHAQVARAYIEVPMPLGKVISDSTNIVLMTVESVDKQKNTIVYRKVRDLKGTHPTETIKHNIGTAGFNPREWQGVMAWAEPGKSAIMFHNGGSAETCIDNYWYQINAGGEWWNMTHAEPYLLRSFAGKPGKLVPAVTAILAGQEVIVPCMVDGDKNAIQLRTAKIQRLRASLKLQDYNAQRDFVDWGSGGDELKSIAGMPGFTHMLALSSLGSGAAGVAPAIAPVGPASLPAGGSGTTKAGTEASPTGGAAATTCVFGVSQMTLIQSAGNAFNDVRLPLSGGARAVAWADYDGDGKLDLLAATPAGPRLFRNTSTPPEKSESGAAGGSGGVTQFEDVSSGLPGTLGAAAPYFNLRAAAWLDYDMDGHSDILLADGFRGLRLYRNKGVGKEGKASQPPPPPAGKWYYAGPFDNAGQKGFDAVYPPELGVDLAKTYSGKNNEKVVWKEGQFKDGELNNLELFKPELNVDSVVYLYRELNVPGPTELPISLGSDDTLSVWLNGQKIHAENVYRGAAPDQALLTLKLRAGKNTLLLKICQGQGQFAFYFAAKLPLPTVPPLFDDVSDAAGLGSAGIAGKLKGDHLAVADVDADGRPDFLYSAGTGVLVLNTPKGFVESKDSGISYRAGGVTPVFSDAPAPSKTGTAGAPRFLFVPQDGLCKLYRNDGKGHFIEVAAQSGDLARPIPSARCAAWVEFKKGRLDLLVGCWKGPNRYFRNNGHDGFKDETEEIGLGYHIYNTSGMSAQDLNKDNVPDVTFNNEGQEPIILLSNPAWFADRVAVAPIGGCLGVAPRAAAGAPGKYLWSLPLLALVLILIARLSLRRRPGQQAGVPVLLMALTLVGGPAAGTAWAGTPDWPTARGNAQRTGNVDDLPGPKTPRVLWVYKSQEQFIAAPVPHGKALYLATLGTLNTGAFHALALDQNAPERVLWSKNVPFITRPTVSAPAAAGGLVVFGDGMHQTDDATLYCLQADTGMPLWRFPVPGHLVHLEAAPTLDKGRVYACGGDAGILCVDARRVTVDGKEQDLAALIPVLAKRWAEMQAKYEQEKKKDPLASPPNDNALPKAVPKLVWQQGVKKWHIDAPPVVAGDFILAASSYLEEEKEGKRCLVCLRASDGSTVWETPLELNPWGGPTVAGQIVLVGCSSIRFDRKLIDQARGEVVALDLASGQVKWRKPVTGGILSPIAVKGNLAVYTATDGRIVARNFNDSQRAWTYEAKTPFFAGAAIAGPAGQEKVYAADLAGVVHAINLADGAGQWTCDVAADPSIQSRSFVFGSPAVHGGDIYMATCNPEGGAEPSYVVCLSDKKSNMPVISLPFATDAAKRRLSIPCRIAPRKLPALKEIYPLEVVATFPTPRGQKAHETVVTFDSKPSEIHAALESLGLKPGKPVVGDGVMASGPELQIYLELPGLVAGGAPRLVPIDKLMVDTRTGLALPSLTWHFTGSAMRQPDPEKPEKVYGADLSGTLISLLPVTDETLSQAHLILSEAKLLKLDTNKALLPPEGTEVKLILQAGGVGPASLPVASLAGDAVATDLSRQAPPWRATDPDPDRPDRNSDSVQDLLRRETLSAPPEMRKKPAPFLRLAIPDPLEPARTIGLPQPFPDSEGPAAATPQPRRPKL